MHRSILLYDYSAHPTLHLYLLSYKSDLSRQTIMRTGFKRLTLICAYHFHVSSMLLCLKIASHIFYKKLLFSFCCCLCLHVQIQILHPWLDLCELVWFLKRYFYFLKYQLVYWIHCFYSLVLLLAGCYVGELALILIAVFQFYFMQVLFP